MATQRLSRWKAELTMLTTNPPPGIICWQKDDASDVLMAEITGPEQSPYEKGTFQVEVSLSERYPFTPPIAKFITPIYHPNVDSTGRICLSGLKAKPNGSWNCSLNIAVILSAIRLLMSEPNLGDPLVPDIASEYQDNFMVFRAKAEDSTRLHATKQKKLPTESLSDETSGSSSNQVQNSTSETTEASALSSSPKKCRNKTKHEEEEEEEEEDEKAKSGTQRHKLNPPKKPKLVIDVDDD